MEITPIDIINARHKYGPLDIRALTDLIKHEKANTMKKYQVITDNLDFLGLEKGAIITDDGVAITDYQYNGRVFHFMDYKEGTRRAITLHPNWFQEIKDSSKEYTKDDVVGLMRDAVSRCAGTPFIDVTQGYFNDFLIKRGFSEFVGKNSVKAVSCFEYTKEDMLSFGREVDNSCTSVCSVNTCLANWRFKNNKS
jgi:hypothetical protein